MKISHVQILAPLLLLTGLFSCHTPKEISRENGGRLALSDTMIKEVKAEGLIASYRSQLEGKMGREIGIIATDMAIGNPQGKLGNWVADLLLIQGRKLLDTHIDISLVNNGGLRKPLDKGPVTVGDIYELMPFDNMLTTIQVKGEVLNRLVQYIVEKANEGNQSQMFPFSGMRIQLYKGRLKHAMVNGKPIDPKKNYTIVTSDYLANGGDNLSMLKEGKQVSVSSYFIREVIIRHVEQQNMNPIEAELDLRLVLEF